MFQVSVMYITSPSLEKPLLGTEPWGFNENIPASEFPTSHDLLGIHGLQVSRVLVVHSPAQEPIKTN